MVNPISRYLPNHDPSIGYNIAEVELKNYESIALWIVGHAREFQDKIWETNTKNQQKNQNHDNVFNDLFNQANGQKPQLNFVLSSLQSIHKEHMQVILNIIPQELLEPIAPR